jgi:hypothetical protein
MARVAVLVALTFPDQNHVSIEGVELGLADCDPVVGL